MIRTLVFSAAKFSAVPLQELELRLTLWEQEYPLRHTSKSLSGVYLTSTSRREDLGPRGRCQIQTVEPDECVRRGPARRSTNILKGHTH